MLRRIVLFSVCIAFIACTENHVTATIIDNGDGKQPTGTPTEVKATIKVSPDSAGVVLPASYTFSGVATGKDGKPTTITWSSSNVTIARIDAKSGVVTSVAPGLVSITAVNEADTTVKYMVKFSVAPTGVQPVPATVKVLPDSTGIIIPATYTYSAAATDKFGKPTTVTWSSSNIAIAKINARSGLVTGVAPGSVSVIATNDADTSVKATVKLTVGIEVQSITLAASLPLPTTLTFLNNVYTAKVGTTADFDVTVSPSNYTFTCGTDNASVALFNAVTVNGVKKCRATFVAVSPLNGISPVQVWALTTTAHTFQSGVQAQLQAGVQIKVIPATGSMVADMTADLTIKDLVNASTMTLVPVKK